MIEYANWNFVYTKQVSQVSCLAQAGFAAFGKEAQLIIGPPMMKPNTFTA